MRCGAICALKIASIHDGQAGRLAAGGRGRAGYAERNRNKACICTEMRSGAICPCKIAALLDGLAGGLGRAGTLRRRFKVSRRFAKGRKGVLRRSTDVDLGKALFGQSTGLKFAVIGYRSAAGPSTGRSSCLFSSPALAAGGPRRTAGARPPATRVAQAAQLHPELHAYERR